MGTRIFLDKLRMICSLDDIGRLQIKGDENTVDVVVDVHGMKCAGSPFSEQYHCSYGRGLPRNSYPRI